MPILIDGNNLMYRLAGAERTRATVRRLTLERTRGERMTVTLVFDGPPPEGSPDRESLGLLTVLYTGSMTADDRIMATMKSQGRDWVVVTDDNGLARRAKEVGAKVRSISQWLGHQRRRSPGGRVVAEPRLSSHDVADWEAFFDAGKPADE